MNLAELIEQYHRLRHDLSVAHSNLPRDNDRVDRLVVELASTERAMQTLRASLPINERRARSTHATASAA